VTGQRPIHVDDEERVATEMARELEDLAGQSGMAPSAAFTDRIMAAVAHEPVPQPARAFGAALAARRMGAAVASIGDAWRVLVGGSTPLAVRAQALALVLVVAVGSLAVAGGVTVGAIDLLNANQPPHPSPTAPQPTEPPSSPSPSPSPNPSPSLSPSTTVEPSTDAAPTPDATETPGGNGTHGGNETPGASEMPGATHRTETATPHPTGTDDHGGGGSAGGETPSPTATEDHGGGSGGSGGSGGGGETPHPTRTDSGGGDG
jgi:uncharacterized membrane protein YgcG